MDTNVRSSVIHDSQNAHQLIKGYKMCIPAMEYYSAIKKNEVLIYDRAVMALKTLF